MNNQFPRLQATGCHLLIALSHDISVERIPWNPLRYGLISKLMRESSALGAAITQSLLVPSSQELSL